MRSSEINIIGAGGHARSVIALLEQTNFNIAGIYDESFEKSNTEKISGHSLLGKVPGKEKKIILAIGDNITRKKFFYEFAENIFVEKIFHPTAIVEMRTSFGKANLVFAGSIINTEAKVGDNNIINTRSLIEHEATIGNHNHISVGAIICGRVRIGSCCFIGAGTVVIDKITICDNVTIGANAVVVKNINEPGIYVGNPARKIK